ncbi:MAG TPA: hypothetical protein VJ599_03765 [Nitrososphaeraceae archaeon]|nr:hypothetical protein [Nitrososphaeraceae archaeon]
MDEVFEVYLSALEGYSESLRSICHDKDFAVTSLLKDDLVKEAIDVELLETEIRKNAQYVTPSEFSEEQRKVLCRALKYYSKYLNASINSIQEALGVKDMDFELTQKHIRLADEKIQGLCKQENTTKNEGIS